MNRSEKLKKKIPDLTNPIAEHDWEAVIRRDLSQYFDVWKGQKQGIHRKSGKRVRPDIILKPNIERLAEGFPDVYFGIEVKVLEDYGNKKSRKIRNVYHQMLDYLEADYPEPIKELEFMLFASNFSYYEPIDEELNFTLKQFMLYGGQRKRGCYTWRGDNPMFWMREFGEKDKGIPPNPLWYPGIQMGIKQLRQLKITYGSKS